MFQEFCFACIIGMHVILLAYFCVKMQNRGNVFLLNIVTPNEIKGLSKPIQTIAPACAPVVEIVTEVMENITTPGVREALEKDGILYRLVIDFIHDNKRIVRPYGLAKFIERDVMSFTSDKTPLFDLDIFQLTAGTKYSRALTLQHY
jgi:hypothetical protein